LGWFDWDLIAKHSDLLRFYSLLIAGRRRHAALRRARFFVGETNDRGLPDLAWHGCALHRPGFDDPASGVRAFRLGGEGDGTDLHAMPNMEDEPLDFEIPALDGGRWHLSVDTALASPRDIADRAPRLRCRARPTWCSRTARSCCSRGTCDRCRRKPPSPVLIPRGDCVVVANLAPRRRRVSVPPWPRSVLHASQVGVTLSADAVELPGESARSPRRRVV
jgi:hypothetical protein